MNSIPMFHSDEGSNYKQWINYTLTFHTDTLTFHTVEWSNHHYRESIDSNTQMVILCLINNSIPSITKWSNIFFNTNFVSSHMYPENPEGTQVIVGSMNMGYISDTARNRTHNLFRLKREPIPLYHSDGQTLCGEVRKILNAQKISIGDRKPDR